MGPFGSRLSAQNGRADCGNFPETTLARNVDSPCSSCASGSSIHRRRGGRTPLSDRNTTPRVRIAEKLKSLTDILKNMEEKPSMKQKDWKLSKPASWETDFPALRNSVFGRANFAQREHELLHKPSEMERKIEHNRNVLEQLKQDSCSDKSSLSRTSALDSQSRASSSVSMRCALKESIFDKLKADSQALSKIKSAAAIGSNTEVTRQQQQQEELPSGFNWTCQKYFESQSNSKGPNDVSLHSTPTVDCFNSQVDFTKQVLQRLESMEQMLLGKFLDGQFKHSLEDMQKLCSGLSNEIELFWSAINQLCVDNEKFREELRSRTALFHHRLSETCPPESGRISRQETNAYKENNSRRDKDGTDSE